MTLVIVLASISLNQTDASIKTPEIKESLPQEQTQALSEKSCAICLSNIQEQNILALPCNTKHSFHRPCILTWFQTRQAKKKTPNCPLCKKRFPHLQKKFLGALENNDTTTAERLLPFVDINAHDDMGEHALYIATRNGCYEIVEFLLHSKADPDATTKDGETALQEAAFRGHTEIIKILLAHNALVDKTSPGGDTALHFASIEGDEDSIELLLAAGAKADKKNSAGETPIYFANLHHHTQALAFLVSTLEAQPLTE